MEQTKPWYLSKGTIGSALGILASAGAFFGYEVDPALVEDLTVQVLAVVTGVTSLVALWGRISATKKIGK